MRCCLWEYSCSIGKLIKLQYLDGSSKGEGLCCLSPSHMPASLETIVNGLMLQTYDCMGGTL